ncbi:MAG: signal peptide peptidase SppA [Deltaproteobacteria bacterium]|nr:MAG: signal peptide peptidase SppA [Deltaproteobacteria bacterium]
MKRLRRVLFALIALFAIAWWLSPKGPKIEPNSVLAVDIEGSYVESAEPPLIQRLTSAPPRPFASLLSDLALAERDPRLAAVVLRVRSLEIGWAKAQELRNAIARLGEHGRRTIAYLEVESFGGNLEYYVASAAQEVFVSEASRVPLIGLAGEFLFFGGLFEKLGIGLEVERVGQYKSAAETFAGRSMSDATREMETALLDSLDAQFVSGIAKSRSLTPEAVRAAIDAAPAEPGELEKLGLVDGTLRFDEVVARAGGGPLVMDDVYQRVDPASVGFAPVATFALVYGSGMVTSGEGFASPAGGPVLASATVSKALEDAANDPEIAAIVFRIDSPGGSSLAADVVWDAARHAREKGKPLVASFSDVAASGGYYVAAGADAIVASPATLTGSIGVFALKPVLGGLLAKLEIGVEAITRGAHADLQLASRPLTPESRARMRHEVDSIYELFVKRVADGRKLDAQAVDAVGRGRVWTGAQAAERGLVDELGGLHEAVVRAKVQAKLDPDADVALVPYPPPRPLAEQIGEMFGQLHARAEAQRPLAAWLRPLERWLEAAAAADRSVLAMLPFSIEIR